MILLDTHVVIWLTIEPRKLSKTMAGMIGAERAGSRGIGIAGVTLMELAMLTTQGRIRPAIPLGPYLRRVEDLFVVLPITGTIAEHAMGFGAGYPKDPADRIIGATARVHGFPLLTRDKGIRRSGEVHCIG